MSNCVDDFWNELAVSQIAAGGAPSVITKDMKDVLKKNKSKKEKKKAKKTIKKMKKNTNLEKACADGIIYRMKNPSYS